MKSRVIPVAFVIGIVAVLNIAPSRDCHTFEQRSFPEGFGPSRGWPFSAVAPANEVGDHLSRASVIQGNTVVYRNAFDDPRHPHLAVNWFFAATDLLLAALLIALSLFLPRLFRRPVEARDAGR